MSDRVAAGGPPSSRQSAERGRPSVERRRISSGGPWEASGGYSRAVVVGDTCYVAGTTDAGPDGRSSNPGDAAGQARATWTIIGNALEQAGFALEDVVRTRTYITQLADAAAITGVHGRLLASVRPAATLVVVASLIEPSLLVEIEVDAVRDPASSGRGLEPAS